MRHFLQPRVLTQASLAALVSSVACYPRLTYWLNHPAPIWYLEATIFLCSMVLWGFVFAWHARYSGRPVIVFKMGAKLFLTVTLIGIVAAMMFHLWLDPSLRIMMPKEYPEDLRHWSTLMLFTLALNQLFHVFAPFAWFLRLLKNVKVAITLTAVFGAFVLAMKIWSLPTPVSPILLTVLLAVRLAMGFLAVSFYLRGGVILSSWWAFLFQARYLLDFTGHL